MRANSVAAGRRAAVLSAVAIAAGPLLMASTASAEVVVTNPSFEFVPPLEDGQFVHNVNPAGLPNDWFHSGGDIGYFNPPPELPVQPVDGASYAFITGDPMGQGWGTGAIFQDVGVPEAGTYTFTADFARERLTQGTFRLFLEAGGGEVGDGYLGVSEELSPEAFETQGTATLTLAADDPLIVNGNVLRLVISHQGSLSEESPENNLLVDNVQMTFTPAAIPEPASLGLLGLGGLLLARRSRK